MKHNDKKQSSYLSNNKDKETRKRSQEHKLIKNKASSNFNINEINDELNNKDELNANSESYRSRESNLVSNESREFSISNNNIKNKINTNSNEINNNDSDCSEYNNVRNNNDNRERESKATHCIIGRTRNQSENAIVNSSNKEKYLRANTKQLVSKLNENNEYFDDIQKKKEEKKVKLMTTMSYNPFYGTTHFDGKMTTEKKSELFKSNFEDDSLDSVDIKELGLVYAKSNTIKMKKKRYFKKIKKKNEKLRKQVELQERITAITDFLINVISNTLNLVAVGIYIMQTIYEKRDGDNTNILKVLKLFEFILSIYFFVEYWVFYAYSKNKCRFIFSWDTFIDLITIIPPIVTYFFDDIDIKFSLLRVFRIFRVFRILRIYKSIKKIMNNRKDYNEEEDLLYNPVKLQVIHTIIVLISNFFIGAGLILGLQEIIGEGAFTVSSMHFFDALYFIIITSTSIGYGDISPKHPATRLFIIFGLFYLLIVVGNQINKLAELMQIWGNGIFVYNKSNHLIVICDSTINLKEFLLEIKRVNYDQEIIIISTEIENLPSKEFPFNKCILIYTKTIDFDVLNRSNANHADSIFLFTNKSLNDSIIKEKLADFLVLKITRYFKDVAIFTQSLFNEKLLSTSSTNLGAMNINHFFNNQRNLNTMSSMNLEGKRNSNIMLNTTQPQINLKLPIKGTKKQIPVMKLKNFMIVKSMYNPGFLTFSQNLMFNDYITPPEIHSIQPVLKSYILGLENRIQVEQIPHFFVGKEFFDVVYNIYFRSIKDIFTKVKHRNITTNRPILLIGIVDLKKLFDPDNEDDPYELFPSGMIIKHSMAGIFICYKNNENSDYLKDFLNYFNRIKVENDQETEIEPDDFETSKIFPNSNVNDIMRRGGQVYNDKKKSKSPRDKNSARKLKRKITNAAIRGKFDRNNKITKTSKINKDNFQLRNHIKEKIDEDKKEKRNNMKRMTVNMRSTSSNVLNTMNLKAGIFGDNNRVNSNALGKTKLSLDSIRKSASGMHAINNNNIIKEDENESEEVVEEEEEIEVKDNNNEKKDGDGDNEGKIDGENEDKKEIGEKKDAESPNNRVKIKKKSVKKKKLGKFMTALPEFNSIVNKYNDKIDLTDNNNDNNINSIFDGMVNDTEQESVKNHKKSAFNQKIQYNLMNLNDNKNQIHNPNHNQEKISRLDIFHNTFDQNNNKSNNLHSNQHKGTFLFNIAEEEGNESLEEERKKTEKILLNQNSNNPVKIEKKYSKSNSLLNNIKNKHSVINELKENNNDMKKQLSDRRNENENENRTQGFNNKMHYLSPSPKNINGKYKRKSSVILENDEKRLELLNFQERKKLNQSNKNFLDNAIISDNEDDYGSEKSQKNTTNLLNMKKTTSNTKTIKRKNKKNKSSKQEKQEKNEEKNEEKNSNKTNEKDNSFTNKTTAAKEKHKKDESEDFNKFYMYENSEDIKKFEMNKVNHHLKTRKSILKTDEDNNGIKGMKNNLNGKKKSIFFKQRSSSLRINEEEGRYRNSKKSIIKSTFVDNEGDDDNKSILINDDLILSDRKVSSFVESSANTNLRSENYKKYAGSINMSFFKNIEEETYSRLSGTQQFTTNNEQYLTNNTENKTETENNELLIKHKNNNLMLLDNINHLGNIEAFNNKENNNKVSVFKHLKNRSSLAGLTITENTENENNLDNSFNKNEKEMIDTMVFKTPLGIQGIRKGNLSGDRSGKVKQSLELTIKEDPKHLSTKKFEDEEEEDNSQDNDIKNYAQTLHSKAKISKKKSTLKSKKTTNKNYDNYEDGTKQNLEAIDELEDNERYDVSKEVHMRCLEIFLNTWDEIEEINQDINSFYDNRIINLDKVNFDQVTSEHIFIVGIQDSLNRLIRLINMLYLNVKICIIVPNSISTDTSNFIKLLKMYKNLFIYIGEAQNPYHLLNCGMNKAKLVLFLSQTLDKTTREDMQNILNFKSVDYFFNVPFIVELWSKKSIKMLGYLPLDRSSNIIINEFLHPQFMAGKLIYHECFDKLLAKCFNDEHEYEVWSRLISLGYDNASNSFGFQPKLNGKKKLGFPAIISFDLPEFYYDKDYHILVGDLLALDEPVIPLGIYVEEPLLYVNLKYEGGISYDDEENKQIGITMSQKNKIKNISQMDILEKKYYDSLNLLKDISYTDKIVMDAVDLERTYLPVFITNPPADFKLLTNIKVQVLCFFQPNVNGEEFKKRLHEVRKVRNFGLAFKESPSNRKTMNTKEAIKRYEEKIDIYMNVLKKRCSYHVYLANKKLSNNLMENDGKEGLFKGRKNAL